MPTKLSKTASGYGSTLFALLQGVQILRVHEVNEIIQSIKIFKKLLNN